MAGQPTSSPLRRIRVRHPPVQAIFVAVVVLFVLFLWLNFALAQEIESVGREIQVKTKELRAIERREAALLKEISAASSEQKMADEAWALGYRPQAPVYVPIAQPLVGSTREVEGSGSWLTSSASGGGLSAYPSRLLWDIVTR